jgi:ribonuclease P protein component
VYVAPVAPHEERLIVSLGRSAGGAVVRSRIRRIARNLYVEASSGFLGAEFLLAARSNVGGVPRCRVRAALKGLFDRGFEALIKRRTA